MISCFFHEDVPLAFLWTVSVVLQYGFFLNIYVTCLDLARCLLAADTEELQLRGNEDYRDSVEIDSVDPNSSEGPSSDDRATCVEEEPLYLTYYRPNWVFEQLPTLSPNSCVCRSWKDRAGGT
ncbi:hypothetical protein F2Q68_00044638 [Brassica cretica]|uniref:Uncharacterized protein n=1 Tax=Brassica cretica TaxID=69181 RepID=A0A8S9LCG7_BRACR|nr:hypothetical protein F2Q68_00044638 [Brassica cretica]